MAYKLFILVFAIFGAFGLQSCKTTLPAMKLDPQTEYKFVGKVCDQSTGPKFDCTECDPYKDKRCFDGVGVIPQHKVIDLLMLATRADLVRVRTCNRTRQLLYKGDSFNFVVTPNLVEQNLDDCDISGEAFDYKKELHSYYWVMIERKNYELPVETQCDGYVVGTDNGAPTGVGACQVGQNLSGLIRFKVNTEVLFDKEVCPFKFFYASEKYMTIGRNFYFTPDEKIKGGKYKCTFVEQVPPFRKAIVGIHVFEEEIFPKENK